MGGNMVAQSMCLGNTINSIYLKGWKNSFFRTPVLSDRDKSVLHDNHQRQWSNSLSTSLLKTPVHHGLHHADLINETSTTVYIEGLRAIVLIRLLDCTEPFWLLMLLRTFQILSSQLLLRSFSLAVK